MALPEHVESARLIKLARLERQRKIARSRGHLDMAVALERRIQRIMALTGYPNSAKI